MQGRFSVRARNLTFEILEVIPARRVHWCVRSSFGNSALREPQAAMSSAGNCEDPVEVNTVERLSGT
jgi:hypothetical protein